MAEGKITRPNAAAAIEDIGGLKLRVNAFINSVCTNTQFSAKPKIFNNLNILPGFFVFLPQAENMEELYVESTEYKGKDFSKKPLPKGTYEDCQFVSCNFSDSVLAHSSFIDCEFRDCNMTMVSLMSTALKEVTFYECKLLGVQFKDCKTFLLAADFVDCNLELTSFYELSWKGRRFTKCNLQEVEFIGTDLTETVFDDCNLINAIFDTSILNKADFTTSFNFSIDPTRNKLRKAKFSQAGLLGLVDRLGIEIV